jgi:hypothetical protein
MAWNAKKKSFRGFYRYRHDFVIKIFALKSIFKLVPFIKQIDLAILAMLAYINFMFFKLLPN